jgi:uncharacterized membrane protein
VGEYDVGGQHGFLLSKGVFTTIDVPGASGTVAFGINPGGDIVGFFAVGSGSTSQLHGFLLSKGVFTTIDVPGMSETLAFGINPQGDIVGYTTNFDVAHGFLLSNNIACTEDDDRDDHERHDEHDDGDRHKAKAHPCKGSGDVGAEKRDREKE